MKPSKPSPDWRGTEPGVLEGSVNKLELSDERRAQIIEALQGYFHSEFDEELSHFRADELVGFMLSQIGPSLYNQAIQDACGYMAEKIDDLDTEFTLAEDI
jgi:uncharacterized protein (DUF2164 family)